MKRKILSLILVFAMTVSLFTVGTGAVRTDLRRHRRPLGRKLHRTLERLRNHPGQQRSV